MLLSMKLGDRTIRKFHEIIASMKKNNIKNGNQQKLAGQEN